jgi:hypothetical protein
MTTNTATTVFIPNNVTSISDREFANKRITSVVIPNSVTKIGYGAFLCNPLRSVTIGADVDLGPAAFPRTGFTGAYEYYGRAAGTYVRIQGGWVRSA